LDKLPLIRAKIFRIKNGEQILVIVQPHIITDGWSLKIIREELFKCYSMLFRKQSPRMTNIKISYFEYIDKMGSLTKKRNISPI